MLFHMKSHANLNVTSRINKAHKLLAVLEQFTEISKCSILDIGTGSGYNPNFLSKNANSVVSVDLKDERIIKEGYDFIMVKDENLPFQDKKFDVVVSNQVIEHTKNQSLHISEISRVVKNGGLVYLATPNRYWVIEPHFHLPFLSWFPNKVSSFYLKLIKGDEWDVKLLTYYKLKKLLEDKYYITNMTADVVKNSDKYFLKLPKLLKIILKFTPISILRFMNNFMPSFIIILKKNDQN